MRVGDVVRIKEHPFFKNVVGTIADMDADVVHVDLGDGRHPVMASSSAVEVVKKRSYRASFIIRAESLDEAREIAGDHCTVALEEK